MSDFNFMLDENNIPGSLQRFMRYIKDFTSNLDESNVKFQAWGDSIVDNVDATHKLKLKFYVPTGVQRVLKLALNFSLEPFRAYETGAASGGYSVQPSSLHSFHTHGLITNQFAGDHTGSTEGHTHSYTYQYQSETQGGGGHSHEVTIPSHSHNLIFGIYESTTATGCKVYVDGVLRLDNVGSGYTTDQANLDLTQWVLSPGWHTVEISSTRLGRINAAYFMQILVGQDGL